MSCGNIRPLCSLTIIRDAVGFGSVILVCQRIANISILRRRVPPRGLRPHDVICQTQTPAVPGAPPLQCILAESPRSSELAQVSGMLGPTHHRRQSAGGPGRINRMPPRAPASGGARFGWAGPGSAPRGLRATGMWAHRVYRPLGNQDQRDKPATKPSSTLSTARSEMIEVGPVVLFLSWYQDVGAAGA